MLLALRGLCNHQGRAELQVQREVGQPVFPEAGADHQVERLVERIVGLKGDPLKQHPLLVWARLLSPQQCCCYILLPEITDK